jgi:hypothetical protein
MPVAKLNAFVNLNQIAQYGAFQQRVQYALVVAANAVLNETNTTTGHATRATYANKVLNNQADLFTAALCILTNSTISAEADYSITQDGGFSIPDSDIQFAVNSLFSDLAGVST